MSSELSFRSRVSSILETLTDKALQDICQLMGETCAALRIEMFHERNQISIKSQAMENSIGKEKPANCMDSIEQPAPPNFPVVDKILNEQEANGIWLERDPTVGDEGPPSLVPEGEEQSQALSQTTDMGVESWPAPLVIKQEEMDDDNMESQGYSEWIPETHKDNQNITGESDEPERSQASGGSKELGLDGFKREQSQLLVSTEVVAAPIKKEYDRNIKRYTCEICGKTETKKGIMTSHMIKHSRLHFSCDICGEKFKLRKFLTRHKHSKHNPGITYSCSVCEKTFLQATSRDTHERGHTGKCGEMFKEYVDRDAHQCIVYKGERPFSCSVCNEDFEGQYHLKQHQLEKHPLMLNTVVPENPVDKIEKTYSCSVCEMMFVDPKSRDNHERKHIGEEYLCSVCGKKFKERQERDTHECIVYKGEQPYSCSVCNEDFERQYHLKKHQLEKHPLMVEQTGANFKPSCCVCGKVFKDIKWLIRHERNHREKN